MAYNSEFYSMIDKSEKILWLGKPDFKCFLFESIFNPLLPFAILWAAFDFGFIGAILTGKHPTQGPEIPLLIIFFLFHLMPVWLYIGGVITTILKHKRAEFVVTDRGVYTSGGFITYTFEHKPFTELSHVNIHRGFFDQLLGVGDVVLTTNHDGYNTRESHSTYRSITLYDIHDYEKVYKLVKQLQTDVYTDTMYPNALRPAENPGYRTQYKGNIDI